MPDIQTTIPSASRDSATADPASSGLHVQYGCGLCAPPSWLNFDASPTLRLQRIPLIGRFITRHRVQFPPNVRCGDIIKGLPIPPESCAAIYCSHILEHLSREDFRTALANTLRHLRPGGIFRLVLPDLEALIQAYVNSTDPQPALHFVESTSLGRKRQPRGMKNVIIDWLSNDYHLWMWDYRSLAVELQNAGFTSIRKCFLGDAADPLFRDVESEARFQLAVAIECARPAR